MTIGLKELLVLSALIGAVVWVSAIRSKMEQSTTTFFRKLNAAEDGEGFGWRGILVAFVLGIACCSLFALVVLRIWSFYHPAA